MNSSPSPQPARSKWSITRSIVTAFAVAVLLAGGLWSFWYLSARDEPIHYEDPAEHFKYGSFGAEFKGGIPLYIWEVLPTLFSKHLPENRPPGHDGYKAFGFNYEAGPDGKERAMPVGAPVRVVGFQRVGLNCATCHSGTYRTSPDEPPRVVVGMPAHRMDIHGYLQFLNKCGTDDNFTAEKLMEEIGKRHKLSALESLTYRFLVIPRVRNELKKQSDRTKWMESRPIAGFGRADSLNPYKALLLENWVRNGTDQSVGTVDFPSLWFQGLRASHWANWDGNNKDVHSRNRAAAMGVGATPQTLDIDGMKRMEEFIMYARPPKPPSIQTDPVRVAAGKIIYQNHCAECHSFGGRLTGNVLDFEGPDGKLNPPPQQTDRHRLDTQTAELAEKVNQYGKGYPAPLSGFRKSSGYLNMPLDGIWLRGPYLHNGSVPTIADLLKPPAERPKVFHRGYDVLDLVNVGFISSGSEAEKYGFRYDTGERGQSNQGHLWGTDLSEEEKKNLIEYLKTDPVTTEAIEAETAKVASRG